MTMHLHEVRNQHTRLERWMLFVDGENFAIRGRELLRQGGMEPTAGPLFQPGVMLWWPWAPNSPQRGVREIFMPLLATPLEKYAVRWHYYTAVKGDSQRVDEVRDLLAAQGFEADVFKKDGERSKGVDISLARDLLGHAYKDNYDAAVLIAGDGDYVPLVEDVKRLGKQVYVVFFAEHGLSPKLKRAPDTFFDFSSFFGERWKTMSHLWSAPPPPTP